jgi:hypothetical protein
MRNIEKRLLNHEYEDLLLQIAAFNARKEILTLSLLLVCDFNAFN